MSSKRCIQCDIAFEVTSDDLSFLEKLSPVFSGRKYLFPEPTHCPPCREQRRWAVRNQSKLYERTCDFTGDRMISLYSSDKSFKVYKESVWWGDQWDPMIYGRDFDFNRPFFDQFHDLQRAVPRRGMHQDGTNENSEYITFGSSNKNCYMAFACFYCEDVFYSVVTAMGRNCSDCLMCVEMELSYECVDCKKCYQCMYCNDCSNCHDSYLLEDCMNCSNCIGCKNLRNKEFHIYNKPVSRAEFEQFRDKLLNGELMDEKRRFDAWKLQFPYRAAHIVHSENCDGDYIENSRNCSDCFDLLLGAEDMRHCQHCGSKAKNMMDCTMCGFNCELLYEMYATAGSYQSAFTTACKGSSNTYYSDCVSGLKDCFGCEGLKMKQHCVLNKQYTKEAYEELVPRIIEHMKRSKEWGEFFPIRISPFAYNETLAQEYFPLSKKEALSRGYQWKDEANKTSHTQSYQVPVSIRQVPDSVTQEALACISCGRNYKIIAQELQLYKRLNLPLPRNCFECRHSERMKLRNPHRLWDRVCQKCNAAIRTSFVPERPEIVYCEKCYLEAVY